MQVDCWLQPGASFEGSWREASPPRKRKKEKKERKKEKKEKKRKKKKKRKKGTMNNVKLLHIKCCFFQFFNSPVALKNMENFCPPKKKSWNDAPGCNLALCSTASSVTSSGICHRNKSSQLHATGPNRRLYPIYYWYKSLLIESFIGTIVWIYLEPSIASRFPGVATPLTTSNNLNIQIFNWIFKFLLWSWMMYRRGKKRIGWGIASICVQYTQHCIWRWKVQGHRRCQKDLVGSG